MNHFHSMPRISPVQPSSTKSHTMPLYRLFQRLTAGWVALALASFVPNGFAQFVASAPAAAPLSLPEAFRIAYGNAPQLDAQAANADAARAMAAAAQELPDPKLKFGVENLPLEGRNKFRIDRDDFTFARIGVSRDFTREEKRKLRAARLGIDAERETTAADERRAQIRRDVTLAAVERHYAAQSLALVRALTGEARVLVDVLIGQVRANRAKALDAGGAQTALRALEDREAEVGLKAARANVILRRWLGDAASRPITPPALLPLDVGHLVDQLETHPVLINAQHQRRAATKEAELAAAGRLADWNLEVSYGQRGRPYTNMLSIFATVDLPAFGEKRIDAELLAKKRSADAAGFMLADQQRQLEQELRLQAAEYDVALKRLALFDMNLIPLSEERAAQALSAYRGGQGLLTDVLDARRQVLEVRLTRVQMEADAARAWAQLAYYRPENILLGGLQ